MNRFAARILLILLTLSLIASTPDPNTPLSLDWLRTQQQADGGFSSGFTPGSEVGPTVEVALAAAAAGEDPSSWRSAENKSPLDYLAAQLQEGKVQDAAGYSRLIFAALAAGQEPRTFAGQDLVAALKNSQDPQTGRFGDSLYAHAYALLALHNAGEPLPENAIALLLEPRPAEGGWAMLGGTEADSSDTNTTALVIQALIAAGKPEIARTALPYLHQVQNADGGFPWQKPSPYGTDSDANSTAVVLQALNALGENLNDWAPDNVNPYQALNNFRDAESHAFNWQIAQPGANLGATAQAVQALEGLTLLQLPARTPAAQTGSGASPLFLIGGLLLIATVIGTLFVIRRRSGK